MLAKLLDPLDGANWNLWHNDMHHILKVYKVLEYVEAAVLKQNSDNPDALVTWEHNDSYAQILISNNITHEHKIHLGEGTLEEMWKNLKSIHEIKGVHSAINLLQKFHSLHADDDTDIVKHLNKLKSYYVCINQVGRYRFSTGTNILTQTATWSYL